MPIKVQSHLPAIKVLESENIFVMPDEVALKQDIRPLKILILNLMPTKITTETQLLRLLGNSPLQVDIELLQMATHTSKNTSPHHLTTFYKTFDEIKDETFDGMIITGAPVEQLDFEQVDYWDELCEIMEWSKHNVYSTFHICWGASKNSPGWSFWRSAKWQAPRSSAAKPAGRCLLQVTPSTTAKPSQTSITATKTRVLTRQFPTTIFRTTTRR